MKIGEMDLDLTCDNCDGPLEGHIWQHALMIEPCDRCVQKLEDLQHEHEATVEALESDLDDITAERDDANADVDDKNREIDALESRIETLESEIADLQHSLNEKE